MFHPFWYWENTVNEQPKKRKLTLNSGIKTINKFGEKHLKTCNFRNLNTSYYLKYRTNHMRTSVICRQALVSVQPQKKLHIKEGKRKEWSGYLRLQSKADSSCGDSGLSTFTRLIYCPPPPTVFLIFLLLNASWESPCFPPLGGFSCCTQTLDKSKV